MLTIQNGSVVDADGARDADVTIEGDRIATVGEGEADSNDVIDASDRYVAPGLIDAHVHLMMDGRPDPRTRNESSMAELAYQVAANCSTALDVGVTTLRDLGAKGTLAIDARAAVESGTLEGPTIVPCGQNITITGGHGHWMGREADGPTEVRKAVREQLKRGAAVIKCMATGGVMTEGSSSNAVGLNQEELETLVETADAQGVPTTAHAQGLEGIKNAVEAGITSIEHGTFMDQEAAEMMAERGTHWIPTVLPPYVIGENADSPEMPPYVSEIVERAKTAKAAAFDHALDAGVPIAMGSDAGIPCNYFDTIPRELELMVDGGMSPKAALEASTVTGASLLGYDDRGLVEEEYHADLVILDSNPLEDPSAWHNPVNVIKDGTVVR